ncbi:hypothetical protein KBD11_00445 [Candidatus Saccharibacteria bacterium]|nr:hypothetical protein [Candidatus Saccharibacteria bacterium]
MNRPQPLWIGRNVDSSGTSVIGDFNGTVQKTLPDYVPVEGGHLTLLARGLPPYGSEKRSSVLKALANELTTPESLSPLDVETIELRYYGGRAGRMSLALTVRCPDSYDFGRMENIVLTDKTYPRNPIDPHITIGRLPEGHATTGLLKRLNAALSFQPLTLERVTHTSHYPPDHRDLQREIDDRLARQRPPIKARAEQAMLDPAAVRTIRPGSIPSVLLHSLRP